MTTTTAPKFSITQVAYAYTVRDASGAIVAVGTFAPPRTYEGCREMMRQRAEFLRRFA